VPPSTKTPRGRGSKYQPLGREAALLVLLAGAAGAWVVAANFRTGALHRGHRRVVMMAVVVPMIVSMVMPVIMPVIMAVIVTAAAIIFDGSGLDGCWGWHIDGLGRGGSAHGGPGELDGWLSVIKL
jgi:hypothetical protein